MKNYLYILLATLAIVSCSNSYEIKGTSDVSILDGRMLYLKAVVKDEVKNIDSCDVVHGKFEFKGSLDSVKVAAIYMDDQNLLPVVLEEGDIQVKLTSARQECKGSPLNDKLSEFTEKYNQIVNERADLEHQHSQAIMNGDDMAAVNQRLSAKAQELLDKEEDLITKFIEENFDNVLAPFAFELVTSANPYPMLNPWIEVLMSKATDTFKNNEYVRDYMEAAERNQAIMNGMESPEPAAPTVPQNVPLQEAPTPNEMAAPAE